MTQQYVYRDSVKHTHTHTEENKFVKYQSVALNILSVEHASYSSFRNLFFFFWFQ